MSERVPQLLIEDILIAIQSISEYISEYDLARFHEDKKTRDAVVRNLEIIGEAANRIPLAVREKYSALEWNKIIRSRHILIHEYADVDYEIVWRIVTVHLPEMDRVLKEILTTLNRE